MGCAHFFPMSGTKLRNFLIQPKRRRGIGEASEPFWLGYGHGSERGRFVKFFRSISAREMGENRPSSALKLSSRFYDFLTVRESSRTTYMGFPSDFLTFTDIAFMLYNIFFGVFCTIWESKHPCYNTGALFSKSKKVDIVGMKQEDKTRTAGRSLRRFPLRSRGLDTPEPKPERAPKM